MSNGDEGDDSVHEQYAETKGEKNIETVSQEPNTYELPYTDQIYAEYKTDSNRSTQTSIQTVCKDAVILLSQHMYQV